MEKEKKPGHILKQMILDSGYTIQGAADAMGMTRQNLGYHLRKPKLDYEFLLKVKDKLKIDFPPIGKMENIDANIVRRVSREEFEGDIKYVPVHAQAGYLQEHTQEHYVDELPSYNENRHEPGTYQAFEVRGDSMEPEIHAGDMVLCKYLDKALWPSLHRGGLFVFVHREAGIVLKQLKQQAHNIVTLHSFNPIYQDYKADLKDMEEIWYYKEYKTFRDFKHKIYE